MGCGGSKQVNMEVDEDQWVDAEVMFVWPDADASDLKVEVRGTGPKDKLGPWQSLDYKPNGTCTLKLDPNKGWNSRWVKGGVKYLTPNDVAPTILRKILEHPKVTSIFDVRKLKLDPGADPQLSQIPDEPAALKTIKPVLIQLEGFLPANTWNLKAKVEKELGTYVDGVLVLTSSEKFILKKREVEKTPEFIKAKIQAIRQAKAAAIDIVKKQLKENDISLDELLGNVGEFFGVDVPPAKLDEQVAAFKDDPNKPLTEAEQKAIEAAGAGFQSVAIARYCKPTENTKVPVRFQWKDECESASVRVWKFNGDGKKKPEAPQEAKMEKIVPRPRKKKPVDPEEAKKEKSAEQIEKERKKAEKEEKEDQERMKKEAETLVGKEAVMFLTPGQWAIQYVVDGKTYYDIDQVAKTTDANPYNSFKVINVSAVELVYA